MIKEPRSPDRDRIIWLRRPARIVESGTSFVPRIPQLEVDHGWASLQKSNPRLTDGPCWHVLAVSRDGHGGATIHVARTTYRMSALRQLGLETGFVGLGTKAVAHWQGKWLIGRRSEKCATYPGHWEFAPGGSVEPGEDPSVGIERELLEECAAKAARRARQIALLFDSTLSNWEIVHELALVAVPDAPPNWEYSSLRMIEGWELPPPAAPCTASMARIAQRAFSAGTALRESRGLRQ